MIQVKESIERILKIQQQLEELEATKKKLEADLYNEKMQLKITIADLNLKEEALLLTIADKQFVVMQGHGGAGFPIIVRVRS
jgi:hypothetical protein